MPPPSDLLLAALNELKSLVDSYNEAYDRAQLLEVAHNAGVLASVEGFDELSEMLLELKNDYDAEEALKAWPVDLTIHMTYNKRFPLEDDDGVGEEEHGFYGPGGWFYCINDEDFAEREERVGRQQALEDMTPEPAHFLRLDEAADFVESKGALEDSGGYFFGDRDRTRLAPAARRRLLANKAVSVWYTTIDPDQDYEDGSNTFYSFHPEGDVFCRLDLHGELQKRKVLL